MSDLIVVAFDDDATAFAMRAELVKLQKEYLLEMEDVVVVTRSFDNKVQLHQVANMTTLGAVSGGFWGMMIGLLFLNPLLGAAVGAGAGALSGAYTDIGIDDTFMKGLGQGFTPGSAAVFVLVRKMTADKVIERLRAFDAKGRVLQTSLTHDDEASLRAAVEKVAPVV
jgi:uncharacterized membrane protein